MKKSILILLVFLYALSVNAQEPVIKIYMIDGSAKEFKINDIADLSFISSNLSYSMTVFESKLNTKSDFDIKTIDSIEFENNQTMNIIQSGNTKSFIINEIDSIIFTFNTCTEIQIGSQIWMCKNLDVDHYRNGDPIPEVQDSAQWVNLKTGAWCYYNNSDSLGKIYGKFYNWYAVNDPRRLAPIGYHVPSDAEWTVLSTFLGGNKVSGGKMKETDTTHWSSPNKGATNSSGFTALPGGWRGSFVSLSYYGVWWSATEGNESLQAWVRFMFNDNPSISRSDESMYKGYSVRCVQGDYTSVKINSIIPKNAKIGDEITISGTGFGFSKDTSFVSFNSVKPQSGDYIIWSNTLIKVKVPIGTTSGKVFVTVNGEKSNEVDFIVGIYCYGDVEIGNKIWMCRNLDVDHYRNGDPIPEVQDSAQWANLTTGAWCYYNNDPANGAIYGKLYNWYAVNDPRGLAPIGYHIPSDGEWSALQLYLSIESQYWCSDAYYTAKSLASKELWSEHSNPCAIGNDLNANNTSGFSALPGGGFPYISESFSSLRYAGHWWTVTEKDNVKAWAYNLNYDRGTFGSFYYDKFLGFSVRCKKD